MECKPSQTQTPQTDRQSRLIAAIGDYLATHKSRKFRLKRPVGAIRKRRIHVHGDSKAVRPPVHTNNNDGRSDGDK